MEPWLGPPPKHTQTLCDMVRASPHPFDVCCAIISEQAEEEETARKAYGTLFDFIRCLWHGMRDEQPLVRPLVQLYYDLEFGSWAARLQPMEPGLEQAEHLRRLALLDEGRVCFKRLLIERLPLLPGLGVRNLVIRWARLMYECVHGFQAPPTTDVHRAMRDAMGLSDHFAELVDEVLAVVDPERVGK